MKRFIPLLLAAASLAFVTADDILVRSDSTKHSSDEARVATITIQTSTNLSGPWTNVATNKVVLPSGNVRFYRLKIGL